jgi:hypothetical protein
LDISETGFAIRVPLIEGWWDVLSGWVDDNGELSFVEGKPCTGNADSAICLLSIELGRNGSVLDINLSEIY